MPAAKAPKVAGARAAAAKPAAARSAPVRALVDSGPLVALFNRNDRWHSTVLAWLKRHPTAQLVSTWPVLTEVCALLARRIHNEAALDFLRWVQLGAIELDNAETGSLAEVLQISERFADLPFDLADASVAEAAQRLRVNAVLTIDADFDVYRNAAGTALRNVLRDDGL